MNGQVYICHCPSHLPGICKIGFTTRTAKIRVAELDNTSVPTPFVLDHSFTIRNTTPQAFEASCHRNLAKRRIRDRREFFSLHPDEAREKIQTMLNTKGRNHRIRRLLTPLFLAVVFGVAIVAISSLLFNWPLASSG